MGAWFGQPSFNKSTSLLGGFFLVFPEGQPITPDDHELFDFLVRKWLGHFGVPEHYFHQLFAPDGNTEVNEEQARDFLT